jgi:hypothetical protein
MNHILLLWKVSFMYFQVSRQRVTDNGMSSSYHLLSTHEHKVIRRQDNRLYSHTFQQHFSTTQKFVSCRSLHAYGQRERIFVEEKLVILLSSTLILLVSINLTCSYNGSLIHFNS